MVDFWDIGQVILGVVIGFSVLLAIGLWTTFPSRYKFIKASVLIFALTTSVSVVISTKKYVNGVGAFSVSLLGLYLVIRLCDKLTGNKGKIFD